MIDWSELTLFLYVIARMSGFILFNPLLGRRSIPGVFRSGYILALSVMAISMTTQRPQSPVGLMELAARLLLELGLGFLLGMAVNFFFYIPQLAGSIIDAQMGMTMNQIYDAGSQSNLSATGVLLNALMTLVFFVGNGHLTMLRVFLTSGEVVPFGQAVLGDAALHGLLDVFTSCTVLGVKLCMPVLAAELVAQLGMGILMKVIPQINVFSINIELKVIIGLVLLLVLLAPFSEFLMKVEGTMLDSLSEILRMAVS